LEDAVISPYPRVSKRVCIIGCAVLTGLVGLGVIALISLSSGLLGPCRNDLMSENPSPDGILKAVVFRRGCGATVADKTEVFILPANASLPNDPGNAFALRGVGAVKVVWTSSRTLRITHDSRYYVNFAETNVPVKWGLFHRASVAIHYGAKIRY
jgi:hypothetical protein